MTKMDRIKFSLESPEAGFLMYTVENVGPRFVHTLHGVNEFWRKESDG